MTIPNTIDQPEKYAVQSGMDSRGSDLLGCPFCGQPAAKKDGYDMIRLSERTGMMGGLFFVIECAKCDAITGWKETEEEANEAWNLRANP